MGIPNILPTVPREAPQVLSNHPQRKRKHISWVLRLCTKEATGDLGSAWFTRPNTYESEFLSQVWTNYPHLILPPYLVLLKGRLQSSILFSEFRKCVHCCWHMTQLSPRARPFGWLRDPGPRRNILRAWMPSLPCRLLCLDSPQLVLFSEDVVGIF